MVGMLLSYALNSALQKRKECLDQLTAFSIFNEKTKHTFKLPDRGTKHDLKECTCQCSPHEHQLPKIEELRKIVYKDCLDLVNVDKEIWDQDKISARWKNLHLAASFVFNDLVGFFQHLRDNDEPTLVADYSQYNDYGSIDMFSLRHVLDKDSPHDNRIFLLYSLVYCTLNPNQKREEFLENFESYEKYLVYFRDVTLADFVSLVPLLRVFFTVHDPDMSEGHDGYWHKVEDGKEDQSELTETEKSNIKNDLENLVDFFLKRSFLEQAYDTGYNVYTAANVYYLAHEVHSFIQQSHENKESVRNEASIPSSFRLWTKKSVNQNLVENMETNSGTTESEDQNSTSFCQYIKKSFFVAIFWGYDSRDTEAAQAAQQVAEVQSSMERAFICFCLQTLLYLGCLLLSTSQECYEDSGLLGRHMKDIISCVVLFFSFQFLVSMAISEFYINSLCMLLDTTLFQKVVVYLNLVVNSFLSLTLVYSSALILKGSTSFVELILNAVAVFFVSELDDMLVSELDEEILEERTVQALIGWMRKLSHKHRKGTSNLLTLEQAMIRGVGLFSLIFLLPCSFWMYFRGSLSDLDCS